MESYIVEIRKPIGERATLVAEAEKMELEDLVDFLLRKHLEDWEIEEEEDDGQEEETEEKDDR